MSLQDGGHPRRNGCHQARLRAPERSRLPFACSTSAASALSSQPALEKAADSVGGAEASDEQKASLEAKVYSSLVKHEAIIPTPSVLIPEWMAETYVVLSSFLRRCGRLFLPETSINNKLPYHKCGLIYASDCHDHLGIATVADLCLFCPTNLHVIGCRRTLPAVLV